MTPTDADANLLSRLIDEWQERLKRGERPDLNEYAAQYPALAEEIRQLFPGLVALREFKAEALDQTLAPTTGGVRPEGPRLERLGDYRILREVGRGGMGVVYEAEQESLGRRVALKVLPAHSLSDSSHQKRFHREAKAAARLHHTNIVPVYGVGEQDGMHYYVMQFIQGLGLDAVLAELKKLRPTESAGGLKATLITQTNGHQIANDVSVVDVAQSLLTGKFATGPLDNDSNEPDASTGLEEITSSDTEATSRIRSESSSSLSESGRRYWLTVARIGIQVAEALEYASSQGILHRDIKPSNLLLDTQGNAWVTDFGLAKTMADGDNLTHTGDIVGTLRYMAPERFEGQSDLRGDIYGLGLTLYELLVRQPAFVETDRNKLIRQVTHEEPIAPRNINPAIPRDLETIVLKAIARDPGHRYQNAGSLAEDLKRFTDDRPILARRISVPERFWRWCRRNPAVASLTAGLAALMALAAVASTLAALHFERLAKQESAARAAADEALEKAETARVAAETAQQREAEQRERAETAQESAEKSRGEAERNFAKARAAVDDYLTKVSESRLRDVPGLQPLRRELLTSALTFYQGFLTQHGNDPELRAAFAGALYRLSRIYSEMGDWNNSNQSLRRAAALYEELNKTDPDDRELQIGLAQCHQQMGIPSKAIVLWENLLAEDPTNPRYQKELADSLTTLGTQQQQGNQTAAALASHQRALELRSTRVRNDPHNLQARDDLGTTLNSIAVLLTNQNHAVEALTLFGRSVEHAEKAFAREPGLAVGSGLVIRYGNIAYIERTLGRSTEALRWYRKAADLAKRLAQENPAVANLESQSYHRYRDLAVYQRELGQSEEAAKTFQQARDILQHLPQQTAFDLYNMACVLAQASALLGEVKEGQNPELQAERKRLADEAVEAVRRSLAAGYDNLPRLRTDKELDALRDRADFKTLLAEAKLPSPGERLDRAASDLNSVWKVAEQSILANQLDLATGHYAIGLLQMDLGQPEAAAKSLTQSLELHQALLKSDPDNVSFRTNLALAQFAIGLIDWKTGRLVQAIPRLRAAIEALEAAARLSPDDERVNRELANALATVGQSYARGGLWHEALRYLAPAVQRMPTEHWHSYCLAHLLAQNGDVEAYRQHCREMLERFGKDRNPLSGPRAGHASLLLPDAVTDHEWLTRLAEIGVQEAPATLHQTRLIMKGITAFRTGQFPEAVKSIENGLRGNSAGTNIRVKGYLVLAMAQHRLGQKDAARRAIEQARAEMRRYYPRPDLGDLTSSWNDWISCQLYRREAETLLEGKTSDDPWEHLHRAKLYAQLGETDQADAEFQAAVAVRPKDAEIWLMCAKINAQLGRKNRAAADFARAIEFDPQHPNDPEFWRERARKSIDFGRADQAAADFARLVSLLPESPASDSPRSRAALEAVQNDAVFAKLLEVRPNDPQLWIAHGRVHALRGNWQQAANDYAKGIESCPPGDAWSEYAGAKLLLGDEDGYRSFCMEKATRVGDTKDRPVAMALTRLFALEPQPPNKAALSYPWAELAVVGKSKDTASFYVHGIALYRKGQFPEAIQNLQEANKTAGGNNALAGFYLALAHHRSGHLTEAQHALVKANADMEKRKPVEPVAFASTSARDWIEAQLLRREAEKLIDFASLKPDSEKVFLPVTPSISNTLPRAIPVPK